MGAGSRGVSRGLGVALAAALAGCGPAELSGHVWSVHLVTATDNCVDPPARYDEVLEFVVDFQGGASIAIGTDGAVFATGAIAGCALSYQTGVWEEEREGGVVRWEMRGEALYRLGGTACELDEGIDWEGRETFTVIASEDPGVRAGCTSVLDARGTYVGER